jgi:hypothetical protein
MDKPKRDDNIIWRVDGEEDQIVILSREDFALPVILNSTAAKIFLLADGGNSIQQIADSLCREFIIDDQTNVLADVKELVGDLTARGILREN